MKSVTLLAVAAVLLAACSSTTATPTPVTSAPSNSAVPSSSAPVTFPITITSDDVEMPPAVKEAPAAGAPQRIITLAKGVGETVVALGGGNRMVGRDEASDVDQIADLPIVTKAHSTNAEKVLSLSPDLVIVDKSTTPPEALTQIKNAGVKVVSIPEAWAMQDIAARTRAVAEAIGASPTTADAVIAESTRETGSPAASGTNKPKVLFLYVRGTSAIYLVGGKGSGADALIDAAGGEDMGSANGYGPFTPLTAEAIASMNPDVILVMTKGLESVGGIDGLANLPGVAQTSAGKNHKVIAVDDTLLLSFGPRTGALVDALRTAIAAAAKG